MKAMIATVKMKYLVSLLLGSSLSACALLNNPTPGTPPLTVSSQAVHDTFLSCLPQIQALPGGNENLIRLQTVNSCFQPADIESVQYFLSDLQGSESTLDAKTLTAPYQVELKSWIEGGYYAFSETHLRTGQVIRSRNNIMSSLKVSEPVPLVKKDNPSLACIPQVLMKENQELSFILDISSSCFANGDIASIHYYLTSTELVEKVKNLGEVMDQPLSGYVGISGREMIEPFKLPYSKCYGYDGDLTFTAELKLKSGDTIRASSLQFNIDRPATCPRGGGGQGHVGGGGGSGG